MTDDAVEQHYTRGGLGDAIIAALIAEGHDPDALDFEALAGVEEFHTLGRPATIALADAAAISAADHVLDVGSGIGGPARLLAKRHGCRVTTIDLTRELVDVAMDLTRRVGLADLIESHHGNALDMPFEDETFDVVWTQHVSMNIEDKPGLFAEMKRVIKPGGRLALFDILAGPVQPIQYPVPWAEDDSVSFLATPDETHAQLSDVGFNVHVWQDVTDQALEFYATLIASPDGQSPLGLQLLIPNLPTKGANLKRNAEDGRIVVVRCVADAL